MIEWLESIDRALFLALNGYHHPVVDPIMVLISEKLTWVPLYLLMAVIAQRKWGWKGLGVFALFAILTVVLTDQASVKLFKEVFERYRPCHNLEITHLIHTVNDRCGGQYGFVSSHAANHFGIAVYFALTLFVKNSRYIWLLMLWAALVSYSRIYLGVHYPSDIIVGGMLGGVLGWLTVVGVRKMQHQFPNWFVR